MTKEILQANMDKTITNQTYGDLQQTLSSNNVLPYVLLLQGLSDLVMEERGSPGQIVRSTNAEVLGGTKSPVEFIPLTFTDSWTVQEKIGQKFEYLRTEPRTAANQDAPWDFTEGGVECRRIKCFNVFALLKKDVDTALEMQELAKKGEPVDPDKALLPVVISFRSMSFPAGKAVSTYFSKAKSVGSPPYVKSIKLACHQEKNDKGTFFVYDIMEGTMQDKATRDVAATWYSSIAQGLKSNTVVMDEAGTSKAEETAKVNTQTKF